MPHSKAQITLTRRKLLAKLAAINARTMQDDPERDTLMNVTRLSKYIAEVAMEFDLTNEEQMMFLRMIVSGLTGADEILKGEAHNGH